MSAEQQTDRLQELLRVFLEENTKLNLSALRTEETCWVGNILDSLPFLEITEQLGPIDSCLDIGTGGGFPLLPLAICMPDTVWTGLDSTQKKITAIEHMADRLNLSNVQLIAGRTEELGQDSTYREQYDCVTARAVAPLPTLLEYMSPFVRSGGTLVCWKSMHSTEELEASRNAQRILHCPLEDAHEYDLGGDWGKRQLLIFRKTDTLPFNYPRMTGEPKGNPL